MVIPHKETVEQVHLLWEQKLIAFLSNNQRSCLVMLVVFVEDGVINLNIVHGCVDAVVDCICYK